MFSRIWTKKFTEESSDQTEQIERLKETLEKSDAVVIGAGAGLSTSAGFTYSGERFECYFSDFAKQYGFADMYSGGFYPFQTLEEHWAYWSRYIWINRYQNAPKPVYEQLYDLVKEKDYFVLTTNVDHCFQKAGFDKHRLFYTQGDYGLFQCSRPCHEETYDNEEIIRCMLESQGYMVKIGKTEEPLTAETMPAKSQKNQSRYQELRPPEPGTLKMQIPSDLVPHCLKCGGPMTMNLRCDDTFVQDEGWHRASQRYAEFLRRHEGMQLLFLELGTGYNTPGIVKYSFWQMTDQNPNATYACLNLGEAYAPNQIRHPVMSGSLW